MPLYLFCQTPTFSDNRGFYDTPFVLSLSTDIPGGTIRYTMDGSPPSTTAGLIYSSALSITTTTVVRAIAYSGSTVSPIATNSYIFLADVIQQPEDISGWPNPVYRLGRGTETARHDYGMDPAVVSNPAYSGSIIPGLLSIPTMSIVMDQSEFWEMYTGDAGFPGSVEIIYPNDAYPPEQFDLEVESHSHNYLKRSIKLDVNNSITSNLLKTNPITGNSATTNFTDTKFVIRGGNNRSWARNWNPDRTTYGRDEWYRASQLAASGIGMRGTFVHLYVNGLYWGLFNPIQRQDAGFMTSYFGGDVNDWMTLNHNGIDGGDATRFTYLTTTLASKNMGIQANYEEAKQYLDVEKFIDYLMITWMSGMVDWPANNYYGGNRNVPPEPFNYYAWDGEWSWDTQTDCGSCPPNDGAWVHPLFRSDKSGGAAITRLWHSLRANPEFMQLFVDRVNLQCFNNGPLSDTASRARWATINQYIETAIIAESARWGDGLNDGRTRTKNDDWIPEVARLDALMNGNAARFIAALRAEGYYPDLDAVEFNKPGGSVIAGFELVMTNPNTTGTIYYTTDGSDPKLANGAVSSSALVYSSPITVPSSDILTINARIKDGTEWSAKNTASYSVLELYINEFLASNSTGITDESGSHEDWIEFYNAAALPVDIGGMYITDNLTDLTQWQIPANDPIATTIPAGGYLLVWADNQPEEGPLHVNIKLGAGGEAIGLSTQGNSGIEVIDSYTFGAQTTDISMGRFPDGVDNFVTFSNPTPRSANSLGFATGIFINEFLAGNVNGITDEAGDHEDWIEIYNSNSAAVDIGGFYITDDLTNPLLFQLPTDNPSATTISPGGYIILWADGELAEGPLHISPKLGKGGEAIGLTQQIGSAQQFIDSFTFGAQMDDVSQGRYPDGDAFQRFFYQPTPGVSNTIPFVTGLSINEALAVNTNSISDSNGEKDPWIEIYNFNPDPIDIGGLFISNDLGNPSLWQIPMTDPSATTIPSGGFITLWADNQSGQGVLHLPFLLNGAGGDLVLSDIIGPDVSNIDSMSYPSQNANISFGRYPDASKQFKRFIAPTPNANNVLPLVTNIFINEFLAGNTSTNSDENGEFEDWVELYNAGSTPVDVGGLFIVDDLTETNPYQIPTTSPQATTIQPGGFLLLWCDRQMEQGVLHVDFALSKNGEQLGLLQKNGDVTTIIDSYSFPAQTDDISEGRSIDGGPTFVNFTTPTPNATNFLVPAQRPFITTWFTTTNNERITIPTSNLGEVYNYTVDWGDGTIDSGLTGDATHTYAIPGTQTVEITGTFPRIRFNAAGDINKIRSVKQWGDIAWSSMALAFQGCANLDVTANDVPNLLGVADMNYMFAGCTSLVGNSTISNWDTRGVKIMTGLFFNTSAFNKDIGSWDTSTVTNMDSMFFSASGFNQDLNSWDTSKVTTMFQMFFQASSFDQDLSGWDISSLTNAGRMFTEALSIANYDALLNGWSTLDNGETQVPSNVNFTAENSQFCLGEPGRTILEDLGWTIFDGGPNCLTPLSITGIELIDADNNVSLGPLTDGMIIDINTLPTLNLTIEVFATSDVESLRLVLSGAKSQTTTENNPLYALYGNSGSNYNGSIFILGSYSFTVTPYSENNLGGTQGTPRTVTFELRDAPPVDNDGDGYTADVDCDDNNFDVNPGATEICDGIDNNCDGQIDEGVTTTYYADTDGDGYGDPASELQSCGPVTGYVTDNTDCNDGVAAINPGAIEICDGIDNNCDGQVDEGFTTENYYADLDGDGYGDPSSVLQGCSPPSGYVLDGTDCDDTNEAVHPGAAEICDGIDNNCDGNIDEGFTPLAYYADLDGDGYGNPSDEVQSCSGAPTGYVTDNTDCDDTIATINPGAAEICDGIDNNCDGNIDEGLPTTSYYADLDGDGFGNPSSELQSCSAPVGYVMNKSDCNDNNASVYPGAIEICDGIDNNCNGQIDETCSTVLSVTGITLINAASDVALYPLTNGMVINVATLPTQNLTIEAFATSDVGSVRMSLSGSKSNTRIENNAPLALYGNSGADYAGSNFGLGTYTITVTPYSAKNLGGTQGTPRTVTFQLVAGLVDNDGDGYLNDVDCNDNNPAIHPGAPEICDGIDNNCDGQIDEGLPTSTYYADLDGDGYGNPSSATQLCGPRSGYVTNNTDCNDNNAAVHPGAVEICDEIDNNCDGLIDGADPGVSCPVALSVTTIRLFNADTDSSLGVMTNGMIIGMNTLPTLNLTIDAMVTSDVQSVRMVLSGAKNQSQIENNAPLALYGNSGSDYAGSLFVQGNYTITVTPYSGRNLTGSQGTPKIINFQLVPTGLALTAKSVNTLTVSPNPATSYTEASFENPETVETIMVFDMLGRLVRTYTAKEVKAGEIYSLDLNFIQPGTYIIRTIDTKGFHFQKQMVIKP